jgi:tetratricopeptide (TPR) repeat protein
VANQIFLAIRFKSKYTIAVLIIGFVFAFSFFYACQKPTNTEGLVYLNHAEDVGYVGIATCASCHPDKHSTFIHTGMGLSFDTASRSKSSAKFGKEHVVYDQSLDMYYYPYWVGEQLFIKEFQLKNGDTIHQLDVAINYIVGSGQHTNSHLFKNEGYLYQAPITFYVQKQKWDLAPGFENGNNSRFSRILNSECVSCHNSMPTLKGNSEFEFTSIGKGIDCERCHGPGELHVNLRKKGKGVNVAEEIDPTIVNPKKLSWERQIDLCQRCHLQGLNVLKEGKTFTDFKPGMKLSDVFEIYLPQYEGNNGSFDMANHSQRLQMSKCFINSNNNSLSFTCITCHNPHISVKQTGKEVYNDACNTCHQTNKCTAPKQELVAAKNNCVSCHMPQSGSEDIPHVSVHDHYIRKPVAKNQLQQVEKLLGLYAVNNPNPEPYYQAKAYIEYWEKFDKNPFWLKKAEEAIVPSDFSNLKLKYFYLTEKYAEAIKVSVDEKQLTAWELFMLGDSYGKLGKTSQAIYYLKQSRKLDNTLIAVGKKLTQYLLNNNDLTQALSLAQELDNQFKNDGEIKNYIAKTLLLLNRLPEAKSYMEAALRFEPNSLSIWEVHLNYYLMRGDKQNAEAWNNKILTKYPTYKDKELMQRELSKLK